MERLLKSLVILFSLGICLANHEFWAIEIDSNSNPHEIASLHGHQVLHPVGSLEGVYLLKSHSDTIVGVTHPHLHENPNVLWAQKQEPLKRSKRISDPLYSLQWHLHGTDSMNVNTVPVWNMNYTGQGVVIAVVDDGLQSDHPDIQANYYASGSYDFNYNDPSPYPDNRDDTHGTSAAGVAGARDNDACGVGSAYRASLAGIRILSGDTTDAIEASALSYKPNENFIYTNSWGPIDDGRRLEGPGPLLSRAFEQSVTTGRNGRGNIYVWAAGNGRMSGDNCNYDGYANSRFTITIGATDFNGNQAVYSESCAMLIASAPSSGAGRSITTTDLSGQRGVTINDCRSDFGGTSAAAPLAAGVVALILQANPFLGWRDVQAILISSSVKNAASDSDWKSNGAGYHVNHKYGFGLVDAEAAVNLATQWVNLGQYISISVQSSPSARLPEGTVNTFSLQVNSQFKIEHVEVVVSINHPTRGELQIVLVSPSGTESILAEQRGDQNANINWTFGSIRCWGESPRGIWQLKILDGATNSRIGTLNRWQLNIYGH